MELLTARFLCGECAHYFATLARSPFFIMLMLKVTTVHLGEVRIVIVSQRTIPTTIRVRGE